MHCALSMKPRLMRDVPYQALTQQTADGNGSEPTLSSLKLTKGAAREVLTSAMPVPELVLNRQIATLSKVSLRLITSLEEDRKRKMEANGQRHMIHASHGNIEVEDVFSPLCLLLVADLPPSL